VVAGAEDDRLDAVAGLRDPLDVDHAARRLDLRLDAAAAGDVVGLLELVEQVVDEVDVALVLDLRQHDAVQVLAGPGDDHLEVAVAPVRRHVVDAHLARRRRPLQLGEGADDLLPRLVGASRAKEIMVTGRQVKSDEALRIGLADEVVEPELLMSRALDLANSIADGASQATRLIKKAVDYGIDTDLASGLALELELFEEVFRTEDSRIGVKSFLENGPGKAQFTGW
ncbi:MAG: hypothetical protein EBS32_12010, partial [Actinobacteria bacterium]|nr:hypothetical protein [Actinomycetota bacterium]